MVNHVERWKGKIQSNPCPRYRCHQNVSKRVFSLQPRMGSRSSTSFEHNDKGGALAPIGHKSQAYAKASYD